MSGGSVTRMRAVVRRDWLIQASYQFEFLNLLIAPFVSAFLAYYVGALIDDPLALQPYDGGYFEYVVAGVGLTAFAGFGISTFNAQIGTELGAGTLEVLLSGSTRLSVLLVGGAIVPFALTLLEAVALFGIGIGFIGVGISPGSLVVATPVIVLTAITFCALGIMSAAFVLLVKRGDPISGIVFQLNLILSGAIIPIELFPGWLEALCRLTPAYYGVRGVRDALLTDGGFASTADELAILAGFSAVLVPASLWMFGRAVRRAKVLGVLGSY